VTFSRTVIEDSERLDREHVLRRVESLDKVARYEAYLSHGFDQERAEQDILDQERGER
jgi:hypothetical protein